MPAPPPFATPHVFNFVQQHRRELLFAHVDVRGRGLEVGPYDQPTVVREDGDVRYLDVQTRDELVGALTDPAQAERVPEVDLLCRSPDYTTVAPGPFDYVIANHVLEHVPNPIAWLQMVASLLRDGGALFLSLPDKKYTFDCYRPDTPLSHLLHDFYSGATTTSAEHMLETELYYDVEFVGQELRIEHKLDEARLRRAFASPPHPGVHCHVFQSESFVDKVLAPLQYLGLVPFELIAFRPARADTGGEFTCVLRKGVPAVQPRREQFFTKDFAPRAPAAEPAPVAEPAPAPPVAPPRLRDVLFPLGTRRRELLWRLKRRLGG